MPTTLVQPLLRLALAALFAALAPFASAASFDCAKARSAMEKLICSDAPLSALDDQLNTAFKEAITRSKARPQLVQWQREWLQSYEVTQCKNARCLGQEFAGRIALLQSVAPATSASAKWNGAYTRYHQGKPDKDSASLAVVGLQDGKVYLAGDAVCTAPTPPMVRSMWARYAAWAPCATGCWRTTVMAARPRWHCSAVDWPLRKMTAAAA